MIPAPPLPLPATTDNMAKRYLCKLDQPNLFRTYTGTGANATTPLYLETPGPNLPPLVKQGVGSPGYWSYSINSVLNSLGRFRNRFLAIDQGTLGGISLPWIDPYKETSMKYNNDAQMITFIEEGNDSLFNDEVMDAPAYSTGDLLTDRHNFGGNVGFLDGHVQYFKAVEFNYQPSALSSDTGLVDHTEAMKSGITKMFFPDGGRFAAQ